MSEYRVTHEDKDFEVFSVNLAKWMAIRGMFKENLADETRLSEKSITAYLRGTQQPTLPNVLKITRALNLDLNTFLWESQG